MQTQLDRVFQTIVIYFKQTRVWYTIGKKYLETQMMEKRLTYWKGFYYLDLPRLPESHHQHDQYPIITPSACMCVHACSAQGERGFTSVHAETYVAKAIFFLIKKEFQIKIYLRL